MTTKCCKRCGEVKPIDRFARVKNSFHRGTCRECIYEDRKKFFEANPGKRASYSAKYYYFGGGKKKQRDYVDRHSNAYKAVERVRRIERQRKLKQRAVDFLGKKCCCCGYDKCLAALEFHHTDPLLKSANSTFFLKWPWAKQLIELKHCILVCANCHREIHASIRKCPSGMSIKNHIFVKNNRTPLVSHIRHRPWGDLVPKK